MAKKKVSKTRKSAAKAKPKAKKTAKRAVAGKKTASASKSSRKAAKKTTAKKAVKKSTAKKTVKKAAKKATKKVVKKAAKKTAPKKAAPKKTAKKATKKPAAKKTTRKSTASATPKMRVPSRGGTKANPSGLSPQDLDHFRRLLLEERSERTGDLTAIRDEALHTTSQEASGNLSNMPSHMAELGSDNYEQEFNLTLVVGEQKTLNEIDAALERIENGTYGVCEGTGKAIGKKRLNAKPWARYCIEYATARETGRHLEF